MFKGCVNCLLLKIAEDKMLNEVKFQFAYYFIHYFEVWDFSMFLICLKLESLTPIVDSIQRNLMKTNS